MSIRVFSQDEVYEFIRAWEHRIRQHILSRIPRRLRGVISPDDVLQDVRLAVRAQLEVFMGTTEQARNTWLTRLTNSENISQRCRFSARDLCLSARFI